jgi:hypothetical protein
VLHEAMKHVERPPEELDRKYELFKCI